MNALHRFYLVLVAGTQPEIEISKQQNAERKRYDRKIFITVIIKIYWVAVKYKKLACHPVRVSKYPANDSEVVIKFTDKMTCTNGNDDRKNKCWKNHGDPEWPPNHTPTDIF